MTPYKKHWGWLKRIEPITARLPKFLRYRLQKFLDGKKESSLLPKAAMIAALGKRNQPGDKIASTLLAFDILREEIPLNKYAEKTAKKIKAGAK
jgi:hypothetical protein